MRILFDVCVLVDAGVAAKEGRGHPALTLLKKEDVVAYTSPYILLKAGQVLAEKYGINGDPFLISVGKAIEASGGSVNVDDSFGKEWIGRCVRAGVEGDYDDPRVLAAAVRVHSAVLATEDGILLGGAWNMGIPAKRPRDLIVLSA